MIDTVGHAAQDPEREQPFAALGLKHDEYEAVSYTHLTLPTSDLV